MSEDFRLTWPNLRSLLDAVTGPDEDGRRSVHLTMKAAWLPGELVIHDHPGSDRPGDIHVMIGDGGSEFVKIAEMCPPPAPGETGRIAFTGEWADKTMWHADWQERIRSDNNLPDEADHILALAKSVFSAEHVYRRELTGTHAPSYLYPKVLKANTLAEAAHLLAEAVVADYTVYDTYAEAVKELEGRRP